MRKWRPFVTFIWEPCARFVFQIVHVPRPQNAGTLLVDLLKLAFDLNPGSALRRWGGGAILCPGSNEEESRHPISEGTPGDTPSLLASCLHAAVCVTAKHSSFQEKCCFCWQKRTQHRFHEVLYALVRLSDAHAGV